MAEKSNHEYEQRSTKARLAGESPFESVGEEAMHTEFEDAQIVSSPAPALVDESLVLESHAKKNDPVNSDENLKQKQSKEECMHRVLDDETCSISIIVILEQS